MVRLACEQERGRLEGIYADMDEGQLLALAADGPSLSREAIQALKAELSRRWLAISFSKGTQPRDLPPQTEFTTRHGIAMLSIFAGVGIALMVLVLRFPQWFSRCLRIDPNTLWR